MHVVCVCVCDVVCGVCLAYEFNSSEQNYFMTQQSQTVHYVHTQGYGTQEISLYAGLPRRQAVLIHSTLRKLWRAETNIIKTAYLWCCATPSTLHTTRTWFWHTATCAVSRSKAIICAITSFCEDETSRQYNVTRPRNPATPTQQTRI